MKGTGREGFLMTAVCAGLVLSLAAAHALLPDAQRSETERRLLAQRPRLSAENVLDGSYFEQLERYLADQFPGREEFRELAAAGRLGAFGLKDSDGYYLAEGSIGRLEYPLREGSVRRAAGHFRELSAEAFEGAALYYTVIPDKNYYLAEANGYPAMDYGRLEELLEEELGEMTYVSVFGCLEAEDYYRTDLHIRQEAYMETADALLSGMGNPYRASQDSFEERELGEFWGTYYSQAGIPKRGGGVSGLIGPSVEADTFVALTNPVIEAARVWDFEAEEEIGVYDPEALSGPDKYDYFLSGARALLTIENPLARTDRELILVRDSFGSSLAPLLLPGYRKVTLVDLRYVAKDLVGDYVHLSDACDVLFACNAAVWNRSEMLK